MKLEQLRCFAEAARTGSLNKAAANLYITQPSVTKMMQALEKDVGEVLLIRKKTGVSLSEQGEVFLRFVCKVLADYDDYLAQKAQMHREAYLYEGTLELVISSSLLQAYYQRIKLCIRQTFPNLKLYFVEADCEAAVKLVQENPQMLALVSCTDAMKTAWAMEGLYAEKVYESVVVACVAKGSRYAQRSLLERAELSAAELINMEFAKKKYNDETEEVCNLRTTNLDMIRQILLSGENVCVLMPQCLAEEKFLTPDIVHIPFMPHMIVSLEIFCNEQAIASGQYTRHFLHCFAEELKNGIRRQE